MESDFSGHHTPQISEHERKDAVFERFSRPCLEFPPKLNFQLQKHKKLELLEVHMLHHYSDDRSGNLVGNHLSVSITVGSRNESHHSFSMNYYSITLKMYF